jgi:hypothetical protein
MEAEQMLSLVRRIRHDFGNHLQVISAYAQMGSCEALQQYIAEVSEDMAADRIIFNAATPQASLYFYQQMYAAYDMGVILKYDDLDIESWEILKKGHEPEHSITRLCREITPGEGFPVVYLSLYEDEQGIDMIFSCSRLAEEFKRFRIERE